MPHSVLDERGRSVVLTDPAPFASDTRLNHAERTALQRAKRREGTLGLAAAAAVIPTLLLCAWGITLIVGGRLWGWALLAAGIVVFFVPGYVLHRRAANGETANLILKTGHCPGCGYDLTGTMAEPDGCRTCPECGGVWRLVTDAAPGRN